MTASRIPFTMNPRTPLLPRLAIAILLTAVLLPACRWVGLRGNGEIKTEQRTVTNFTNIDCDGVFEVNWASGASALKVETDENLLTHIRTAVKKDTLKIKSDEQLAPSRRIVVTISSPSLTGARFAGATRFNATNLSGPNFYLDTAGATRVSLAGNTAALVASMKGASRLDAEELHCQTVELAVAGAGKAEVWASEILKASITGAGNVTYSGNPKKVERDITGAGKIRSAD